MRSIVSACLAALATGFAAPTWAQKIYTCVDASGRRLTADRPILDCIDREQRILTPSGTLYRTLEPSYTAAERAALEEKARREAEERSRQTEERQHQRALLVRYPSQEVLDRERTSALSTVDDVIGSAQARSAELMAERRKLEQEAAPYAKAAGTTPARLKHAIAENDRQLRAQESFIAQQSEERLRINERFDKMQRQLNALWAQQREAAR